LWQAHATGNYAPQLHKLHHPEYPQFNNSSSNPSSYNYPPKQSSLEETLKKFMQLIDQPIPVSQELSLEDTLEAFRQTTNQCIQELKSSTMVNNQCIQELKDAAMANTEVIARLEGQFGHLVVEFNNNRGKGALKSGDGERAIHD
jgi:hypothetical protein